MSREHQDPISEAVATDELPPTSISRARIYELRTGKVYRGEVEASDAEKALAMGVAAVTIAVASVAPFIS